MAIPRNPAKLVGIWTRPWRIVLDGSYVHIVEDLQLVGKVRTHVSWMWLYLDS